jgi:uncharacterized protein
MEKRFLNIADADLHVRTKTDEATNKRYLEGYGAVMNHKSKIIYEYIDSEREFRQFFETIETGAFDEVLEAIADKRADCVMTLNHRLDQIMGRTKSGTLTLTVDEKGLFFRCELPNTQLGNDTYEMISRGDYFECSFSFGIQNENQRWEKDEQGIWVRTIKKISRLTDVCVCSFQGAYSETDISVAERAIKEMEKEMAINDDENIAIARQNLQNKIFLLKNK